MKMADHDKFDTSSSLMQSGRTIAQRAGEILTFSHPILTPEDYAFMMNFLGEYKPLEANEEREPQVYNMILLLRKNKIRSRTKLAELLAIPEVSAELVYEFHLAYEKVLRTMDPITQTAIRSYVQKITFQFSWFSPAFFLRWATTGNTASFTGRLGSGKTDFAIMMYYMGTLLNKLNENVDGYSPFKMLTNVKITAESYDSEDYMFSSFGELTRKLIRNAIQGYHTLIVFDEAVASGTFRKTAMHGKSIQIEQIGRLARKFNADFIRIYHFSNDISTEDTNMTTLYVEKLGGTQNKAGRKKASLLFTDGSHTEKFLIGGIPQCPITYDTNWTASFDSEDLMFSEINNKFAEFQSESASTLEIWQKMEVWINKKLTDNKKLLSKEEKNKILVIIKTQDWRQQDLEDLIDCSFEKLTKIDLIDIEEKFINDPQWVVEIIRNRHMKNVKNKVVKDESENDDNDEELEDGQLTQF